jgi:pyruvate/2-oxoglutarate dehydrogenase complex dihydrolipoamide acyltransferase (E2) component
VGVDKTNHEWTAPADGVIEKILVRAEETFARGAPLGVLRGAS